MGREINYEMEPLIINLKQRILKYIAFYRINLNEKKNFIYCR